jgi:hypothetical protein
MGRASLSIALGEWRTIKRQFVMRQAGVLLLLFLACFYKTETACAAVRDMNRYELLLSADIVVVADVIEEGVQMEMYRDPGTEEWRIRTEQGRPAILEVQSWLKGKAQKSKIEMLRLPPWFEDKGYSLKKGERLLFYLATCSAENVRGKGFYVPSGGSRGIDAANPSRIDAVRKGVSFAALHKQEERISALIDLLKGNQDERRLGVDFLATGATEENRKYLKAKVVKALLALLDDSDAELVRDVVHHLGKTANKSVVPYLIPLVGHEKGYVAHVANDSLSRITYAEYELPERATSKEKLAVVKQWKAWWEEHKDDPPGTDSGNNRE